MEVFDPFEIPKLPQRDDDNIFDEILAQDSKVDLPTITAKKKSILNVEKKKTIKKTLIGNDIFTNFNLPDIITTTISTVPKGNKVNLSSSNSKGAFVAPDKVLLNREYSVPKQSSDVLLHHRSETPKDFVPVDFKKEPPKSILKPRALSKPKYSN
uniref:Uncharacterized protein n=1 Tax=Strongyloides venezuelensis TaxID=75913 RepID=A0A0K0FWF1_STRVS